MSRQTALRWSLFLMRLAVFTVMLMWTLDKFVNPGHATKIFATFYSIQGLKSTVLMVLAALELLILGGFLLGIYKRFFLLRRRIGISCRIHPLLLSAIPDAFRRLPLVIFCGMANVGGLFAALSVTRRR
ncbi:hypothetical protein [Methylomonas methanica]|uniref:DoxX family protein n=1 Tax=Methylomonas methanica (strain DSM 25384 / MC09) TaxID=857087 RepID=F9ZVE8_METMM|nr:hypothetical protein [Methylomonas methanica]AEG01930.1 hypothetical protein Metme_3566 [Methylomonas methanica MC09]